MSKKDDSPAKDTQQADATMTTPSETLEPKRMTAAEKRKIELVARKEAVAERKKQALLKIQEEKEAKIKKLES